VEGVGEAEEVGQQLASALGEYRLGVKLDSPDRVRAVPDRVNLGGIVQGARRDSSAAGTDSGATTSE
jgi:hypothetical protein